MNCKDLELEYEFPMKKILRMLISIFVPYFVAMALNWNDIFIGMFIPPILALMGYVVLDSHNDNVKERNDKRLTELIDAHNFIQLTHANARRYF